MDGAWLDVADRVEIGDLLARFAHAIDRCDWLAYRSVFTDEIDLDYSSWRAGSVGRWPADEWVARASAIFPGLTGTRHSITNLLITPTDQPGGARVRSSIRADHALDDGRGVRVFSVFGYYDDLCVRATDGWRITGKRLVVEWTEGDPSLMDAARERVDAGQVR